MATTSSTTKYYDGYYVVTTTTCTNAVAAVPGTPAVIEDFSTYTWDTGARSAETFVDIGYVEFLAPSSPHGIVLGLNENNTSTLYTEINHGYYFVADQYWVVVSGAKVGAARPAIPESIHVIAISAGTVYYVVDGEVVYSTATTFAPNSHIFADVSLYGPNDAIGCVNLVQSTVGGDGSGSLDPEIVPIIEASATLLEDTADTLNASAALDPITMAASADIILTAGLDGSINGSAKMQTTSLMATTVYDLAVAPIAELTMLTSSSLQASEITTHSVDLPMLTSTAYDYDFADARGDLPALTSYSTAGFDVIKLQGANFYLTSAPLTSAYMISGGFIDSEITLPALDTIASDVVYGESNVTLTPLIGLSFKFPLLDGAMYAEMPLFPVQSFAKEEPLGGASIALYSDNFVFTGVMGGEMRAVSPEFTFTGDMTFPAIGRAEIEFGFDVTTAVTVEAVATAELVMRMRATLLSYSGNGLAVIAPQFTASSNVISGAVAEVYVDFGAELTSSVTAEAYARAEVIMPEAVSLWGTMYADAPQFTLNVEGSEVVVRPTMAYVSHLSADAEMTAYTGYDFDSVVYFKGHYYGIKSDGMYLLEGADDGGTFIDVDVKTQEFDFDTARKKRIPYLYAGSDNVFNVTPFVDGVNFGTYTSTKGEERVYLPQGATGRYWQFEYQNINGNNFALDSVDIVMNTLRRKV